MLQDARICTEEQVLCVCAGCHSEPRRRRGEGPYEGRWLYGSGNGSESLHAAWAFPFHFIFTSHRRTVPRGGFTASQDDIFKVRIWITGLLTLALTCSL